MMKIFFVPMYRQTLILCSPSVFHNPPFQFRTAMKLQDSGWRDGLYCEYNKAVFSYHGSGGHWPCIVPLSALFSHHSLPPDVYFNMISFADNGTLMMLSQETIYRVQTLRLVRPDPFAVPARLRSEVRQVHSWI